MPESQMCKLPNRVLGESSEVQAMNDAQIPVDFVTTIMETCFIKDGFYSGQNNDAWSSTFRSARYNSFFEAFRLVLKKREEIQL
jgi:hypothetical protein